eukprot:IDg12126t1
MLPLFTRDKFDICTDYACFRWLLEITDSSGRLMQWRMRLAEFDFEIKHNTRSLNAQADAISRLSTQGLTTENEETEIPCLSVSTPYPVTRKKDEVKEEKEEQVFEDEEVSCLDIIVANLTDVDEFLSKIGT